MLADTDSMTVLPLFLPINNQGSESGASSLAPDSFELGGVLDRDQHESRWRLQPESSSYFTASAVFRRLSQLHDRRFRRPS